MTKPLAQFPDAEVLTKDLLKALLAPHEADVDVGVGLPASWDGTTDYLQVELDGTPTTRGRILQMATIRITAWSASRSRAKELANLADGLLCAHAGGGGISSITHLTGPLVARDPDNRGQLASVTVQVAVRSAPIT